MFITIVQTKAFDLSNFENARKYILAKLNETSKFNNDIIIFPEMAYPAYILGNDHLLLEKAQSEQNELIKEISKEAKRLKSYIAIGMPIKMNEVYYNAALLFDREGNNVHRTYKSNLWHFDHKWFKEGKIYQTISTDFGQIGIIICADGRMPEITRILSLKGAKLIVDLANLTASGRNFSSLNNAQSSYMLKCRAMENNVWFAMADKVGIENKSVVYCGKSMIVSPTGDVIAQASSESEEIINREINLDESYEKVYNFQFDLLGGRHPEEYLYLIEPTENTKVYKIMNSKKEVAKSDVIIGYSQFVASDEEEYLKTAQEFIKQFEYQDADIIVLPEFFKANKNAIIEGLLEFAPKDKNIIVTLIEKNKKGLFKTSYVIYNGNEVYKYQKIHLDFDEMAVLKKGNYGIKVLNTARGNIGIMHDIEGMIPEVTRVMMLKGANVIVWYNSFKEDIQDIIAKTRAVENKLYIICINSLRGEMSSKIVDPSGNIISMLINGSETGLTCQVPYITSCIKRVVPGTDIVLNRMPELYQPLVL